jgi:hypothetical protein
VAPDRGRSRDTTVGAVSGRAARYLDAMAVRRSGSIAGSVAIFAAVLALAACGSSSKSASTSTASTSASTSASSTTTGSSSGSSSASVSASDKASGVTVTVVGDRVTVSRSAASTAGTGGMSGQVACATDYRKLATATAEPAPSLPWYAATLITWPAANKAVTATLSHALSTAPDLCIAESSITQTQVVVYFRADVKDGISRLQQAAQATAALGAAAQEVVASEKSGAFRATSVLVKAFTAAGLYVKQVALLSNATETGTLYVITGQTTAKQIVLAIKGSNGVVHTATQGLTGKPKLATAKSG